ncbi:MAG TPA: ferritin-like domain-containing protein [Vicinamibacteria bacterium]|nr:ferritin-like domain-containing protein [Vicinamibacteria bacterium]
MAEARRDFVLRLARGAGWGAALLGLLDGTVRALPKSEETDLAILDASLTLEHEAIAIYEAALQRNLFLAGLRAYAVEFVGDHKGHRDTQLGLVEERGARPAAPLDDYHLEGMRTGDAAIRRCLEVEIAAQRAYQALNSQIRTRDYLLTAAFILVDEVRHETVWKRVTGIRIY